jgi:septal ring factor EnvC (AmiA/AmiB activator)
MTKVSEAGLAELKGLIIESTKNIDQRLIAIENGQRSIEIGLAKLEEKTDAIDKRLGKVEEKTASIEIGLAKLDEKVDGVSTRLGILENRSTQQITWFLAIITAVFTGLFAIITKVTFFPSSP